MEESKDTSKGGGIGGDREGGGMRGKRGRREEEEGGRGGRDRRGRRGQRGRGLADYF